MKKLLLLAFLFFPLLTFASAGFAKSALWLSKDTLTEGGAVTLYASLSNPTEESLTGKVTFSDSDSPIGSVNVTLAKEESRVVSVSWKAIAGSRTLHAVFADETGKEIDATSLTVTVAQKQKPKEDRGEASLAAAVESSEGIQKQIEGVSPAVANVVNPAFATADSLREQGVEYLDKKIAQTQSTLASLAGAKKAGEAGQVEGTETESAEKEQRSIAIKQVLHTILLYLMQALRFVLASAALFYPILAILLFVILYKIFRRFRRPSYSDI